jgi:Ca2+-binding RTX toxin-like protein
MALPENTKAFYFYAEPQIFDTFSVTATASDGTTSGPVAVRGQAGAKYFGFYTTGGSRISTITVDVDPAARGFAVGEFGIHPACTITGTRGDDELEGTRRADVICGLGGVDAISGRKGNDILRGGPGVDTIVGGPGPDELYGEKGFDALIATDGVRRNDSMNGGRGVDTCRGDRGDTKTNCG